MVQVDGGKIKNNLIFGIGVDCEKRIHAIGLHTVTLGSTGGCIVSIGTRSGTFHSAQTVGTSRSGVSISIGIPSEAYTFTKSPEWSTNFIHVQLPFRGTISFTFSSVAKGNSS